MTETHDPAADEPRLARTFEEVEDALLSRWPETRMEPSLDRIRAFTELLGDPQRTYPVIHLTGTNGKTSTARMIDTLLRALELRTGRFTSPHVERMTERISLDGEPMTDEQFVRAFNDVAPYTHLVDQSQPHPLSFFETVVGMAYAAFADAPVDVAIVEVGLGGTWDATNVADATVAVVLPVAVDHAHLLGDDPVTIAGEKAGIIKPGSIVVVAEQLPDVEDVLRARATDVGARLVREGVDFGVVTRSPAVGGQVVSLQTTRARYDEVFLPLYGAHQAQNAAVALVAVEAFLGTDPLDAELVNAAFAEVSSPGRLEVIRRSPTILLDAAHNPHGAEATAAALEDSFQLDPVVGVIGVMADKDHEGLLAAFEPHLAHVVCTQNSTPRALSAAELAVTAREVFGEDRVTVAPFLPDAIDQAVTIAESGASSGSSMGAGAVLVTGSVVTVGEARRLLGGIAMSAMSNEMPAAEERSPRRGMCAAILSLEGVTLGLTTPVMISVAGVDTSTAVWVGLGLAVACFLLAGLLRGEWAYALGWVLQGVAIGLGFVIPLMFVLGAIFGLLWGTAYFLGRKIERERAEAYAARARGEA